MGLVKRIQKKRQEKVLESAIRYGFILLGFNAALTLAFFFALVGATSFVDLMNFNGLLLLFIPLLAVFAFAGFSAIIWYRFGQIMRRALKQNPLTYSSLAVVISVVPLLLLLLFLTWLISAWSVATTFFVSAFIGTALITVLAIVFEIPVVSLGVMTRD
ncbi:MAG: hypothetical protein A2951_02550 [Candidatus Buchananbacteria bacterium RIFCSPLOWO2_01_FULL_56_15]|uniref:Uncharacterized protein n=1 Tax=Candidatus Buchananbacteria bacterium RIFCSPLOWO2_01_FULL_56_15 TaxID=1797547 RepID=A0A1G1YSA8_9BACT|nr:MAG: hypothetical protein A2951_02550 [Candidatus Buchananbacteria bacterium RIFCSPLOWO2_01_FULL_56_15]